MALDGEVASVYGYSFILTDHPAAQSTADVEHHHRQRGQIEERLKDAKLGQALRHLPVCDLNANRVWMFASLLALNLSAMVCELSPAAGASGAADERTPLRRHAKALRRMLFCVSARVLRSGRQTILRLPASMRKAEALIFQRTYDAVWALAPPERSPPALTTSIPTTPRNARHATDRRSRAGARLSCPRAAQTRPEHPTATGGADFAGHTVHQPWIGLRQDSDGRLLTVLSLKRRYPSSPQREHQPTSPTR